jgi:hypothetical protein
MTRLTQPSSSSLAYLRKKEALHKQLRAEVRADRKAKRGKGRR